MVVAGAPRNGARLARLRRIIRRRPATRPRSPDPRIRRCSTHGERELGVASSYPRLAGNAALLQATVLSREVSPRGAGMSPVTPLAGLHYRAPLAVRGQDDEDGILPESWLGMKIVVRRRWQAVAPDRVRPSDSLDRGRGLAGDGGSRPRPLVARAWLAAHAPPGPALSGTRNRPGPAVRSDAQATSRSQPRAVFPRAQPMRSPLPCCRHVRCGQSDERNPRERAGCRN